VKREAAGRTSLDVIAFEAGLSPLAMRSTDSRGRRREEAPCLLRTEFQRDRDRILHCKAFRRLKHKTQVFIAPEGDHYRTRLTHTLEVAGVARAAARALRLNEDLTEAIALGHDLGHTPFGHAGEEVLNEILEEMGAGGFRHNEQSLRVVDTLENDGAGLNLTWEVRDGIRNHTGAGQPATLEGKIVHVGDRIAYVNHDLDDALRAGLIGTGDLPPGLFSLLGNTGSERIDTLVHDLVDTSVELGDIGQSRRIGEAMSSLREFLFATVYARSIEENGGQQVRRVIRGLFCHFLEHPDLLPSAAGPPVVPVGTGTTPSLDLLAVRVADYVAGMTDRFAMKLYFSLSLPKGWAV